MTTTTEAGSPGYIRMRQLRQRVPVAPSTIWAWVAQGRFPRPVHLAPRVTAWPIAAIEAWERRHNTSTGRAA